MKYRDIIKHGYVFDASGINNPESFEWEKKYGVYYPVWSKVIHAADCIYEDWDEDHECPTCPVCGIDYLECPCPGPTQGDEFDYKEIDGILYAKKKKDESKKSKTNARGKGRGEAN